jgi:hypothetical protein
MLRSTSLFPCAIAVLSLALASCDSGHKASARGSLPSDEGEKPARDKVCSLADGSAAVPSQLALNDVCGCAKVEGDLSIDASAVRDIECLRSLREVTGKLEISTPADAVAQLTTLRGLERLERVHALFLSRLAVPNLKPLGHLAHATELTLIGLDRIHDLRGLERARWTALRAEKLEALQSLEGLKVPEKAARVALSELAKLESLQPLEGLREAESIALTRLPALTSLEGLGAKVDHFELSEADGLTDLRGLRADIREFWLSKNAQLRSLEGFVGLQVQPQAASGSNIRVESHAELASLTGLFRSDEPRLDRVQLTGLPKLQSVDFRSAREARVLVVRSCTALREVLGLESVETLEVLYLTGLSALANLPSFSKLRRIEELELLELPVLQSLERLASLTSVDRIALNYLDALPNLRGLQGVATAQRILLEDVPGLETLEGLEGLKTVDTLWISNADKLTTLRGLALQEARELAVRYNDKLRTVEGLETLRKVGTLDVSENPTLTSLRGLASLREADKVFARLNGKLSQCELDRLTKQLPEETTREFADNSPAGTCTP